MDISEKKKIDALENELVGNKPWQLRGEVSANSRPVNSLLFEDVNFEKSIKAPIITPETTETLEDIIKARIKDGRFDDPIRKVKPAIAAASKNIEISAEKSKVGLAQIYEQELIAKAVPNQEKDGPEKEVERKLLALFKKLDALNDR